MITLDELKRLSGQLSVDVTILEKDYCLGWFLKGLSENSALHENLAFKGATAIKKAYFPVNLHNEANSTNPKNPYSL